VQVSSLQAQLEEQSSRLAAASSEQAAGAEYIAKLEGDMASLSDAYQDLQQSHALKEQEAQALQAQVRASGTNLHADAGAIAAGNESLAELLEVRQEMDDLLVCLGQEEQKVEILAGRLRESGVDPDPLIAHIGADGSAGTGDTGEGEQEQQQSQYGERGLPEAVVNVGSWLASAATPSPA
jgi:chromosome segregation ATPase